MVWHRNLDEISHHYHLLSYNGQHPLTHPENPIWFEKDKDTQLHTALRGLNQGLRSKTIFLRANLEKLQQSSSK